MKVLPVVSGGMDSVTMLHELVYRGYEVDEVISYDYGQRHVKELEYVAWNVQHLRLQHKIIDISFMAQLLDQSALTGDTEVPEGHYEQDNMSLTVVPNRNMILAAIAIGRAVNNDCDAIALGVHSGDHAIYPDCRPEFVSALRTCALIANYKPIDVLAPYLDKDKGKIIETGLQIGVDYSHTWTCYKGLDKACGVCGSCQERLEGFAQNNIADPLEYDSRELLAK